MTKNGKRIKKLFKDKSICCYCGCLLEKGQSEKRNSATVEHVYSRLDIRRYAKNGNLKLKLACRKCNNTKGADDSDKMNHDYKALVGICRISLLEFVRSTTGYFCVKCAGTGTFPTLGDYSCDFCIGRGYIY